MCALVSRTLSAHPIPRNLSKQTTLLLGCWWWYAQRERDKATYWQSVRWIANCYNDWSTWTFRGALRDNFIFRYDFHPESLVQCSGTVYHWLAGYLLWKRRAREHYYHYVSVAGWLAVPQDNFKLIAEKRIKMYESDFSIIIILSSSSSHQHPRISIQSPSRRKSRPRRLNKSREDNFNLLLTSEFHSIHPGERYKKRRRWR